MTVNMTINGIDTNLVATIKNLIQVLSPKSTFLVEEVRVDEERRKQVESLCGGLARYANPALIKKEKDAWAMAVREKYAVR